MNTLITTAIILACLCVTIWVGMRVRRFVPEHHLSADARDVIKLAMGLVATMAALLLGLLVSSAKDSYDTVRSEVIQLGAKVAFFDRVLGLYGPEASPLRAKLSASLENAVQEMWPEGGSAKARDVRANDAFYTAVHSLSPQDDTQRTLKEQALSLAVEIAQLRTLMGAQAQASISLPLLVVVVLWLVIIFFGFTLLAPPNATAIVAILVSAVAVAGATFLILEMDHPFTGLIRIASEPLANALSPPDALSR